MIPGEQTDMTTSEHIKTKELIRLVIKMRLAQKEYFRVRSAKGLDECKRLEKAVDEGIAEWMNQPALPFGGEDP
jgi:hypothetical protein